MPTKRKTTAGGEPSVKVSDMKPERDAKGGGRRSLNVRAHVSTSASFGPRIPNRPYGPGYFEP